MHKSRKTAFIIGAIIFVLIGAGFLFLFIRVKNTPEITVIQTAADTNVNKGDLHVDMPIVKGWNDSGFHANQYDAKLYNNTFNNVKDWSITLKLPNNAKVNDSWNISIYENDDGTVTIINTPNQGFNDIIEPKEFITFGFILFSNSDEEITDFVVKATPEAKITDYPLYYILLAMVFINIVFVSINIAVVIKDHQYKVRTEHDRKIIIQSMKTFTNFIDAKDKYTRGHSIRVGFYTKKIAERMDFDEDELDNIYYIALLHDVGKINISDVILNKPGKLDDEERDIIKTHTTNGAQILKDFSSVPHIVEGARYHHERYDGKGYPEGLSGEQIPLVARIIGVADAFDAMNSDRCYRKAYPMEKIVKELKEGAGKQFDPEVVKVMLELIEEKVFYGIGSDDNEE
ncbi:HDIG domain-containing protein [Lachnospiraceae bacterium G41]|nr:HDIG domain-containing protein [Lachnospiraceae bacterium G41]